MSNGTLSAGNTGNQAAKIKAAGVGLLVGALMVALWFIATDRSAHVAPPLPAAMSAAPVVDVAATQAARAAFVATARSELDRVDQMTAKAVEALRMGMPPYDAYRLMKRAHDGLLAGPALDVPAALAGDAGARAIADEVQAVVAVRAAAFENGMKSVDERSIAAKSDMVDRLARADKRAKEARRLLDAAAKT